MFLLDEPLSNLDAKLRARRDELKRFHQRVRTTTIYVATRSRRWGSATGSR